MILDSTAKSVRAYLSGAAATTNPVYAADWGDHDGGLTVGNGLGSLNGATPVSVVPAPAGTAKRQVRRLNIFNVDTAAVTVTVEVYNTVTQFTIGKFTLAVGEQAEWHDGGWQIRTASGDPRPVTYSLPAGGNAGEIQYNSSGALAGAANVEIESGNLRLVGTSVPTAPASGNLLVYSRNRAGRMLPEWIGPAGLDTSFQPALFGNSVTLWLPSITTTVAIAFGVTWLIAATQAHPTISSGSILNRLRRATYTTTAVAGNAASIRSQAPVVVGEAGFFFAARFGFVTVAASQRFGIGLSSQTTAISTNWSTINNSVCIGKDDTDTNIQLIFRDATAATKVDLGIAPTVGDVFDVLLFAPPNYTSITARVVRLNDGTVYANNTVHTANIPLTTTAFTVHAMVGTQSANEQAIALNRMYLESDL